MFSFQCRSRNVKHLGNSSCQSVFSTKTHHDTSNHIPGGSPWPWLLLKFVTQCGSNMSLLLGLLEKSSTHFTWVLVVSYTKVQSQQGQPQWIDIGAWRYRSETSKCLHGFGESQNSALSHSKEHHGGIIYCRIHPIIKRPKKKKHVYSCDFDHPQSYGSFSWHLGLPHCWTGFTQFTQSISHVSFCCILNNI